MSSTHPAIAGTVPVITTSSAARLPWLTVGLCLLAYIFSYLDRLILSLLVGPIRADLQISDTQFGLLTGLAFALFYATLGIPIAGLSDRISRPKVIATGIAVWSFATVWCGLSSSFTEIFIARILVGAGEAALAPAVYSLLSDLFPKDKIGRALSAFTIGLFIGSGAAFLVGGSVIAAVSHSEAITLAGVLLKPWQVCFVAVGLPGFLVAAAIGMFVRDPHRTADVEAGTNAAPSLLAVLRFMGQQRLIFLPHFAGFTCMAMATFSFLSWGPAFLMRAYKLNPAGSGLWFGTMALTAGIGGVLTSGYLSDRLRGADSAIKTGMIGGAGVILPAALMPFMPSIELTGLMLFFMMFFNSFPMCSSTAVMQIVPPKRMRSRVSALFLLCNSLGGLALGAYLVGLMNDKLFTTPAGVGSSLAVIEVGSAALGVILLSFARAPMRRWADKT